MGLRTIVDKLNQYEGAFEKLGFLLVVVFLLLVVAGLTDSSSVGRVMTIVLSFLAFLSLLIGYVLYKAVE